MALGGVKSLPQRQQPNERMESVCVQKFSDPLVLDVPLQFPWVKSYAKPTMVDTRLEIDFLDRVTFRGERLPDCGGTKCVQVGVDAVQVAI